MELIQSTRVTYPGMYDGTVAIPWALPFIGRQCLSMRSPEEEVLSFKVVSIPISVRNAGLNLPDSGSGNRILCPFSSDLNDWSKLS